MHYDKRGAVADHGAGDLDVADGNGLAGDSHDGLRVSVGEGDRRP
jgi:hypothetical protein